MAVAVESPFALLRTVDNIPSCGTFVAGRKRRINNDPYGGEGYVWEDITVPPEDEQDISAAIGQEAETNCPEPAYLAAAADAVPEQRSVATKRLDQLKQHLLDILPLKKVAVEGFSMDNIHLGSGQDWEAPQLNCAQHACLAPTTPQFNHDWQQYAQRILFGPQGVQPAMAYGSYNNDITISRWPAEVQHSIDVRDSMPTNYLGNRTRSFEVSFEPVDVHCSSWSSLMAHRRRRIAAIA